VSVSLVTLISSKPKVYSLKDRDPVGLPDTWSAGFALDGFDSWNGIGCPIFVTKPDAEFKLCFLPTQEPGTGSVLARVRTYVR
jgi:hypothetical protein